MNAQALTLRLQSLSDAHKQTVQLISRLSKLPAQLGSSALNPDAADARQELSGEIHQSLKEQDEDLELLRQEIEDQTNTVSWTSAARRKDSERERDRTGLAAQVARLGEDLKMWEFIAVGRTENMLTSFRQCSYTVSKSPATSKTQRRSRQAKGTGAPLCERPGREQRNRLRPKKRAKGAVTRGANTQRFK